MTMWVLLTITLLAIGARSETVTRFTNIQCEVLDNTYCAYKKCELKVLGRGVVGLNVHAILLKGPFNNAKINLSLWRKYNGFRPFMFNSTFDFCKFMAKTDQKLSFERLFFDTLRQGSNVNHTCPYAVTRKLKPLKYATDDPKYACLFQNAIIVREMVLKEEHFKYFPLPSGEYKFRLMGSTNNDWKTIVNVYIARQENLMR
ncbi:hypothetical protein KR222_005764, partial [Zaprionus bogoriensis]